MTEPGASPEDPWIRVEYAYSDNSLDPGLFVENTRKGSVVSRANSIGSTSASSVPNTDDEDSDYHQESYKESYKDRRRRAHTQSEQKRRDAIKRGYDDLQTIVPTCLAAGFSIGSQKLSKAIVLQKTIDYIQFLHKEKKKQEEEVSTLRKDVTALKIMKVNYEQIVRHIKTTPTRGRTRYLKRSSSTWFKVSWTPCLSPSMPPLCGQFSKSCQPVFSELGLRSTVSLRYGAEMSWGSPATHRIVNKATFCFRKVG
ncbi:max-like protein X isoform X1 [Sciurus carolinensis]|uniref:max-like protein X isoform X1 n=2 Tax=Sciurus carolinensis TaxID=30640 RepID=UPI001FB50FC4|nr:max-like protein X isoform X1 [Sciurus carolinensis]